MHLQQTKRGSRLTGGPQYHFSTLKDDVKHYLRLKKAVPVALVTPYGATPSKFMALSFDVKLSPQGEVVPGREGHDRIQQAAATESIGEAIRRWYKLPPGDFERIDVEINQILDGKFYLTPIKCKYAGRASSRTIQRPEFPLSFNHEKQSVLWRRQLMQVKETKAEAWRWSLEEIHRVMSAHQERGAPPNVHEADLLRASGSLKMLGIELGPYLGRGLDCEGRFQFLNYDPYTVPVEIKKDSREYRYQQREYPPERLSRVVILCARHNLQNVPANVDIIELRELCNSLG